MRIAMTPNYKDATISYDIMKYKLAIWDYHEMRIFNIKAIVIYILSLVLTFFLLAVIDAEEITFVITIFSVNAALVVFYVRESSKKKSKEEVMFIDGILICSRFGNIKLIDVATYDYNFNDEGPSILLIQIKDKQRVSIMARSSFSNSAAREFDNFYKEFKLQISTSFN